MEVKLGNRRLKMIDGKVCIVRFNRLGVEIKSGRFTPIKFSTKSDGYKQCKITIDECEKRLYEHRLVYYIHNPNWDIWDSSPDNLIDHYNRKRDDNRLENLHVVNGNQNQWNNDAKGYYWDKKRNKWATQIALNGNRYFLGYFENEEDARNAYLEAKAKYHVIAAPLIFGHAAPTD